jgi:hypothetical protein
LIDERLAETIGHHLGDGSSVKNPEANGYRVILTGDIKLLLDHAATVKSYFRFRSMRIKDRG